MSYDTHRSALDLVRWTFTIDPTHRSEIEGYLHDLGADVLVREGVDFLVTWDEPEAELVDVIETIWSLNGAPIEVIQEEFQRLSLHTYHDDEDELARDVA